MKINTLHIYLVGFMGTGKTAVGRRLAQTLGREFVEMDQVIEEREGKKIVDIFSDHGEEYFRGREKAVLQDIAKASKLVVSCGGGIVIDNENIQVLKKTGVMVCLTASPEVIYERVHSCTQRPLLQVADPKEKIRELIKQRQTQYAQAHYCIDTSSLSVQGVAEKIVELLTNDQKNITHP
jgi:shikimate kinase